MATKAKKTNWLGKNNPFYGRRHSTKWKSQESRRKKGKNNPMYGKRHSQSTIRKMRQAMMRRLKKKG